MYEMQEVSPTTRSSTGLDGQEVSPPPVSNMQGQSANVEESNPTSSSSWIDLLDGKPEEKETNSVERLVPTKEPEEEIEEKGKHGAIPKSSTDEFAMDNASAQVVVDNTNNNKNERERRETARKKRVNRTNYQRIKLEEFNQLFKGPENWSRYLTLTTEGAAISALELDDYLLSVHATEEMSFKNKYNDKNTWIIRTTSREQSEKFLMIKEINGITVSVKPHAEMNSVWGTILLFKDDEADEERCKRILKHRHGNVEEVKFITLKRTNTKIAKIKFKGKDLPEKIFMGGRRRDMKPYIPKPAQCHNCSKYGHFKEFCRSKAPVCFYCASPDHTSKWQCGRKEKCINCSGEHHARSQQCPFYIYNSQVRHLQIRSGMSTRDAREQLKERGIKDPFKNNSYASIVKGKQNHQKKQDERSLEEDLAQTQMFTPTTSSSPKHPARENDTNKAATKRIEDSSLETRNRFSLMSEEKLDDEQDEIVNSKGDDSLISMSDMDEAWESCKSRSKPQRKLSHLKSNSRETKGAGGKRSRETSPKMEANPKQNKKHESPPNKRNLGIGYSSSSEEGEKMTPEEKMEQDEEVFQIPTIVSSTSGVKHSRERIPNPFRSESNERWDRSLLAMASSRSDEVNDLEGVRDEMNKMVSTIDKGKKGTNVHTEKCGCGTCFWKEVQKKGKLTEKGVSELIETFIQTRDPKTIPSGTKHCPTCLCINCIKEKVKESRETTVKQITDKTRSTLNRDPRTNKERRGST